MKPNRRTRSAGRRPQTTQLVKAGGRRLWECLAIVFSALTVLIILSLASFHADDQAMSTASTSVQRARNWVGPFGAFLADGLIQFMGWTAWLAPVLSFYLALILFVPPKDRRWRRPVRLAGILILILALGSFPSVLGGADPFYAPHAPPGGLLGQALGVSMSGFFGQAGSAVLLTAFLLLGIIMATGVSFRQAALAAADAGRRAWTVMAAWTSRLLSREPGEEQPRFPPSPLRKKLDKKPEIVDQGAEIKISQPVITPKQTVFNFRTDGNFELPPLSLLSPPPAGERKISRETLLMNSRILEKKLKDFGIDGQVTHVHPGPVITMYEYAPAAGIKLTRIASLADDLAMAMSAYSVRVVAPIPGKSVVGIEIPNAESETVYLLEILTSEDFKKTKSKLAFALGKDIFGHPVTADLARMPHLLIAGATGTGKSVMLNTLICSILFRATPDDVRFLLIDPKMVELMPYEGIPHLITPVVTNPKQASWALKNVVRIMEERYRILAEKDAKNIESYNQIVRAAGRKAAEEESMPYLVIVIDELADLMMLASSDVEDSVTRLAQMARAVGIHLVLATQRPSVNVITGVIKANLPTRISFQVSSKNDSRIILDANGAEQLLGRGDMLFMPPGASKLRRIHGAFIAEAEIKGVMDFIKKQAAPKYDENILRPVEDGEDDVPPEGEADEKYQEAVELVRRTGQASISMIQRRLRVGYNRAARMVEMMEKEGIISSPDGIRPRRILPRSE